eukprot:3315982-Pyramimonas_sp.AAC.1
MIVTSSGPRRSSTAMARPEAPWGLGHVLRMCFCEKEECNMIAQPVERLVCGPSPASASRT